ncbi:MAG TPA: vitamin K epoxide reductase family protein [Candidatus Paceibacterota bacterium]|nr:vitamin K epoxide reductase family protein [Candidatus Paceibacterota bacterium]
MRISKAIVIGMFITALIGFADSAYLTAEHVRGILPPCTILKGCEAVLASGFSSIGPVPVSATGLLFYGAMIVLLVMYFDSWDRRFLHRAAWLSVAGFLGTLYFVAVQAFILHAFCQYCMLSALTSTTLLILGIVVMKRD